MSVVKTAMESNSSWLSLSWKLDPVGISTPSRVWVSASRRLPSTLIGRVAEVLSSVISPPLKVKGNQLSQSAVMPSELGARPLSVSSWLARIPIPEALLSRMSPEPAPPRAESVLASTWIPSAAPRATMPMLPARLSLASARSEL